MGSSEFCRQEQRPDLISAGHHGYISVLNTDQSLSDQLVCPVVSGNYDQFFQLFQYFS